MTATARRAITERLPNAVALAAGQFIAGPVLENPRRVGRPLVGKLAGTHKAELGREWRVLYKIDDAKRIVTVLNIAHRSVVYRPANSG